MRFVARPGHQCCQEHIETSFTKPGWTAPLGANVGGCAVRVPRSLRPLGRGECHDLLCTDHPDDLARTRGVGSKLAARVRCDQDMTIFGHCMDMTGWMVLRNNTPAALLPNQPNQQNQETTVPLPTRTPFPTYTIPPPTPTFAPTTYESLIPEGWKQYKYAKVELWMPDGFVKKSSSDDLVYAENKNVNGNGFTVSVGLTNDATALTDLDDYIQ